MRGLSVAALREEECDEDFGHARSKSAPIELPPPEDDKSCSVFEALEKRRTIREIDAKPLPLQMLSNLLWAAWGVNRTTGPFGAAGRTAASASNSQEIDLYVLLDSGAYLYHAAAHRLEPVAESDLRKKALTPGQRDIDVKAPVQFVYVVDIDRLTHTVGFEEPGLHDPEVQKSYYFVDTGLDRGERLSVRRGKRFGGVVPQLRPDGPGDVSAAAARAARSVCAIGGISGLAVWSG